MPRRFVLALALLSARIAPQIVLIFGFRLAELAALLMRKAEQFLGFRTVLVFRIAEDLCEQPDGVIHVLRRSAARYSSIEGASADRIAMVTVDRLWGWRGVSAQLSSPLGRREPAGNAGSRTSLKALPCNRDEYSGYRGRCQSRSPTGRRRYSGLFDLNIRSTALVRKPPLRHGRGFMLPPLRGLS
jgi:hypothetical protein